MKTIVIDDEQFNLKDSLISEELEMSEVPAGVVSIKGVVVLGAQFQVLPMISKWLTYGLRYNRIAPGAARTYGSNLGYFLEYLQSHPVFKDTKSDNALLEVEEHNILEYITYMKDTLGLKSTTIRNRDASFMSFFGDYLCATRGNKPALREDNPYEDGLISASANSRLVEMCSIDELVALLQSSKSERERALIQFMYDSGVRRSEACKISKQQFTDALEFERRSVIIDDRTLQVPSVYKPFYVAGVKGRRRETKQRNTVVSEISLIRVKRYHSSPLYRKFSRKYGSNGPAFLNSEGNPYTPSSISKLFARLSKRALKRGAIKRGIHPHMMRHGFAGSVLRSPDLGSDAVERLMTVKECLGHAHLSTTQIYTSLPYDIYGTLCDDNGQVLTRSAIMERVYSKTKLKIKIGDEK